jgi:hypothetical protein
MSENGWQPPSAAFMQACSTLEIQQVFTSDNHPKGNLGYKPSRQFEREYYLSHGTQFTAA